MSWQKPDPAAAVIATTIVVILAFWSTRCALPLPAGAGAKAAEATYTAELLRCVDDAPTLDQSMSCRDAVDARWHVDAGAYK